MKQLVLAIIVIGSAMVQAEAKSLTDAVREGYEVKTASGFWVILQKGKSIVFCDTTGGATDRPCTVVE